MQLNLCNLANKSSPSDCLGGDGNLAGLYNRTLVRERQACRTNIAQVEIQNLHDKTV